MSVEVILKNIYCFLEVLQSAGSEDVIKWDQQSLEHAFTWADHCEKIYKKAEGKPYSQELDKKIYELGKLPWALGNVDINLALLSQATSSMRKTLLQNGHLSPRLLDYLVKKYVHTEPHEDGTHSLVQDCWSLGEAKALVEVCHMVKTDLCPTTDQIEKDVCAPQESLIAKAQLLLTYMDSTLGKGFQKEKTRIHLHQKLAQVWGTDAHGQEIVLMTLLLPVNTALGMKTSDGASCAQLLILEWVLNHQNTEVVGGRVIWDAPEELLCQVAEAHFRFFTHYLHHLVEMGENMLPEYPEPSKSCPFKFRWRSRENNRRRPSDDDYQHLVANWRHLLMANHTVAEASSRTLHTLSQKSDFNVWISVLQDAKTEQALYR